MLPGKKYAPEDVLQILRKRFWVVVLPWAIVAAATAGIARKLPDLYRATALIQVVPPQVPDSIVRSFNTARFEDRLQATQQTILSRTRLESIIQEFDLYKEERRSEIMDQVVDNMRSDIRVDPVSGNAFTVTYIGRNPVTVMKVTARLAGYFKDESVADGERRAESTNAFVESQVEDAKRKLVATENKLTAYKMLHSGELPTQLGANMGAVQTIQQNLTAIAAALSTDITAKATLERLIETAETQTEPVAPPPPGSDPATQNGTAAQRLALAKAQLTEAVQVRGLKPDHFEVKHLNGLVASLTKQADAEALRSPVGTSAAVSPAEQAREARLANWRAELERVKKDIDDKRTEEKRLRTLSASYQAKADKAPVREAELTELLRDYEVLKGIYLDFVGKREASNASVNLERRQIGEQFNLLDQARLPERPFSPDRTYINLFGLVGGLALGLSLVALLEYKDSTFKADYELASVLALPVLAVVPLMRSDAERRAEFRKQLLLNVGLGSAVALCVAVVAYSFIR